MSDETGVDVHGVDVGAILGVLSKRNPGERLATVGVVVAALLDEHRELKGDALKGLSYAIDQAWGNKDAARE